MRKRIFTLLMVLCSVMVMQAQTIRYIAEDGTGDGTSWENASGDIQVMMDELTLLEGGGEVWIKAGTYIPEHLPPVDTYNDGTGLHEREKTFFLKSNVSLYGGFSGTESNKEERDLSGMITILSGSRNETDAVYHVIVGVDVTNIAIDGFTILNGKALSSDITPRPTGFDKLYTFGDYTVNNFEGGGMQIRESSLLTFSNLIVKDNLAADGGGIALSNNEEVTFKNVIIENNKALGDKAGGMMSVGTDIELTDVTIRNNYAKNKRGGVTFWQGAVTISNVYVDSNESPSYAGMYVYGAQLFADYLYIKENFGGPSSALAITGLMEGSTLKNISITENKISASVQSGAFIISGCNNLILEGVTIERNESEGNYGLLFFGAFSNGLTIKDLKIQDNISSDGLALNVINGSTINLFNSIIKNNIGYVISMNHSTASVKATNILISNNKIEGSSATGAIGAQLVNGNLSLINSAIINNSTQSGNAIGGIADHTNLIINNSIVWGNKNGLGTSNINAVSSCSTENSLIEGYDLREKNGLDGSQILSEQIFEDYSDGNYSLLPWRTNPVIDCGDNTLLDASVISDLSGASRFEGPVDLGCYEAQSVYHPFVGGTLNDASEHVFTYTGSPVGLSMHPDVGAPATFTYEGQGDIAGETGSDLPADAGVYTVTATISGGTYDGAITTTVVRIHPVDPPFTFATIPAMLAGDTHELEEIFEGTTIEYTSSDEGKARVNGKTLTAEGEGQAIITAVIPASRNYNTASFTQTAFIQNVHNDDATIAGIRVNGVDAEKALDAYMVNIPFTTSATIEVITASSTATFTVDGGTVQDVTQGINIFTGTATDQDRVAETGFTLTVNVQSNNTSATITVDGQTAISTDGDTYKFTIPFATEAVIGITPDDAGATVNGGTTQTIINLRPGDVERSVTVIAEDGTRQTYTVAIYVKNNIAHISRFTVNGATVTSIDGNTHSMTVGYTGSVTLSAVALDNRAIVSGGPEGRVAVRPGENSFTYRVTSEDGMISNTYTLNIYVTNNDASLAYLKVDNSTATLRDGVYYATLRGGATTAVIEAAANSNKATIRGNGQKTVVTGENRFSVMVIAEDGTAASYPVVITVRTATSEPDPDPEVTTYTVTYESNTGGDLTVTYQGTAITSGASVNAGSSVTVTATPTFGGVILESLTVNGNRIESGSTVVINGNTQIVARFTLDGEDPDIDPGLPTGNVAINDMLKVWSVAGQLHVETSMPTEVMIYAVTGKLMGKYHVNGMESFTMPPAIYIVKAGVETKKIIVNK